MNFDWRPMGPSPAFLINLGYPEGSKPFMSIAVGQTSISFDCASLATCHRTNSGICFFKLNVGEANVIDKCSCGYAYMLSHFSRVQLCDYGLANQVPLSMGFSRQEYRSGLPYFPPGVFPIQGLNPGQWFLTTEPQADSLPSEPGRFLTIWATREAQEYWNG